MENLFIEEGQPLPSLQKVQEYVKSASESGSASPHVLLVKVSHFGLNRMDIMQREGKYPVPPQAGPIMGVEFAGEVVDSIGEPSKDESHDGRPLEKGDRVFGLCYGGAYAQYVTNPAKMCIRVPEGMKMEVAASLPEVWFTALQALYLVGSLKQRKGERVLIHAGASGVGLAAIQLAKAAGCSKIYATAGSEKKLELCRRAGATRAINYREEDYAQVILDDLGNPDGPGKPGGKADDGVDFVLDFIGKDYWEKNIRICARDARIVYLAFMSGAVVEKLDLAPILLRRLSILGTTLRSRTPDYQGQLKELFLERALPKLEKGEFESHIDRVYDWTEIQDAQRRMQENAGDGGKIICRVQH